MHSHYSPISPPNSPWGKHEQVHDAAGPEERWNERREYGHRLTYYGYLNDVQYGILILMVM